MKTVNVYDPPQCCSTGVCGPEQDDTLAQFAAALEWLRGQGCEVNRYNLGHQPGALVQNPLVKSTIDREGMDCLPIIVVDGEVAKKGGYLSRPELADKLGLKLVADAPAKSAGRCCPA